MDYTDPPLGDYLEDDWDPRSATIQTLVRILAKHEVLLPPQRNKKEVYVDLFATHIAPRRKLLRTAKVVPKAPNRGVFASPRPAQRTPKHTPVSKNTTTTDTTTTTTDTPTKRPSSDAALEPSISDVSAKKAKQDAVQTPKKIDNDDDVFSDENPFQTPSKPTSPTKKIRSSLSAKRIAEATSLSPPPMFQAPTNITFEFMNPSDMPVRFEGHIASTETSPAQSAATMTRRSKTRRGKSVTSPGSTVSHKTLTDDANQTNKMAGAPKTAHADESENAHSSATMHATKPAPSTPHLPGIRRKQQSVALAKERIVGQPIRHAAIVLCLLITVALSVMFVHWGLYLHPSLQYCIDTNASSTNTQQAASSYMGWNPLGYITPQCISCPEHAVCNARTVMQCVDDTVLTPSRWPSHLFGDHLDLFPIGQNTCMQDTKRLEMEARKHQRTLVLVDILDDLVRLYVGNAECGTVKPTADTQWAWEGPRRVIGLPLALSKTQLRTQVPKKWNNDTFEEYWHALLAHIANCNAANVEMDGKDSTAMSTAPGCPLSTVLDTKTHTHRILISHNPPVLSFRCRVNKHVWATATKYAVHMTCTGLAILFGMVLYVSRLHRIQEQRVIDCIIADVIDMVHCESDNHFTNPVKYPAPGLSITHLRDHLVPSTLAQAGTKRDGGSSGTHGDEASDTTRAYVTTRDAMGHTQWHIHDASTRTRVWKSVCDGVKKVSAIRKTTMEIKGMPQDLWMWVASPALSPRKPVMRT